jgi:hypothetical protein
MGWWPVKLSHLQFPGLENVPNDKQRSWLGLDFGNNLNYRSNALSGGVPRTYGVTGLWHRDGGKLQTTVGIPAPIWAPISGSWSAWCGLRAHNDNVAMDATPGVNNPYGAQIVQFSYRGGPSGSTFNNFPGYPKQVDQMLYRDFCPEPGQPLTIGFSFVTRMSTGADLDPATIHGWFDKDPLKAPTLNDGNYISAVDAGNNPPVDSFMVYLGVPVDDGACTYSDGSVGAVYDPLRRWFSEVVAIEKPYVQLASVSGTTGQLDLVTGQLTPIVSSQVIPAAVVDQLRDAGNGCLRLVFRVKTNRDFDDGDAASTGYTSNTAGAAILDDVTVSGAGGFSVGFEDAGDVDNVAPPTAAFHTTGKPPAAFWHVHDLATLAWEELCGPPDSPARTCNVFANVLSGGDHDNGEAAGGANGTAEQAQHQAIASPTLNLVNDGVGLYNGLGIDEEIASRDEINTWYDIYAGRFDINFTGNWWRFAFQSYPVLQSNGAKTWGSINFPGIVYFNPDKQCYTTFEYNVSEGVVTWNSSASASPDHPDSVRVLFSYDQLCYRFNITSGCSSQDGMYIDNVALAFNDMPPLVAGTSTEEAIPGPTVDHWQPFHDAFPANGDPSLPGTAGFDTTSAHVKSGLNTAPTIGLSRPAVPGDSSLFKTTTGPNMRVDMVFRIRPGPGNYNDPNDLSKGLKKLPADPADPTGTIRAIPGPGSLWGVYMADPGARSSPGAAAQHAAAPGGWDADVWNSARLDTAERNLFPVVGKGITSLTIGTWCSNYHDDDPHGGVNGGGQGVPGPRAISKHRCFLIGPTLANNSSNITCSSVPAWVTAPGMGYDGNPLTSEYSKILEDGQFTPGTSVQYFVRNENTVTLDWGMVPDTSRVTPQLSPSTSTDGFRWLQFGVLPDRWKDYAAGPSCLLFVDNADRRGNEGVWIGVADSIGATLPARWGAHNGWHAVGGGADINDPANNRRPDGSVGFVSAHGGQPGTVFDMYGIRGAESLNTTASGMGSRLAPAGTGLLAGKESRVGPTLEMLEAYYPMMLVLTGDIQSGLLGPYSNRMSEDVGMLRGFLESGTAGVPRGLFIMGDSWAEAASKIGGAHVSLLRDMLGLELRNSSYRAVSGNIQACADLVPAVPISSSDIYGVSNECPLTTRDVLQLSGAVPAVADAFYQDVGSNGPYIAGVTTPLTGSKHWITQADGFDIEDLQSRFCEGSLGRLSYFRDVFVNVFGSLCALAGSPVGIGDDPHALPGSEFLRLTSANPFAHGSARLEFGLTSAGKVEVGIYDVAGRKVRVLADRVFRPGRYELVWDGRDDGGRVVPRGVYFYRLKSPLFETARRLVVLK